MAVHLTKQGIGTAVYYPVPVHYQPAYQRLSYVPTTLPIAEYLAGHILSLLLYPQMPADQLEQVACTVREFK